MLCSLRRLPRAAGNRAADCVRLPSCRALCCPGACVTAPIPLPDRTARLLPRRSHSQRFPEAAGWLPRETCWPLLAAQAGRSAAPSCLRGASAGESRRRQQGALQARRELRRRGAAGRHGCARLRRGSTTLWVLCCSLHARVCTGCQACALWTNQSGQPGPNLQVCLPWPACCAPAHAAAQPALLCNRRAQSCAG